MTPPILFDMDGIILDGPGTHPMVYADAADLVLDEFGVEPTHEQRRDLRRHGLDGVDEHCTALGIDPEEFWYRLERYASDRTHERIESGERGWYDDIDAIDDLAERTTIGLVTNNRQWTADFVTDYFDLDFAVVQGRDPTPDGFERRKPDPYYIERALSALDIEDGIYVGDRKKDVTAGDAAGLETALIRREHNRDLERPERATYDLDSLRELLALD
ncbi:HAD family hydrolase [Natrialbaceae archaeon A-arb3/5]